MNNNRPTVLTAGGAKITSSTSTVTPNSNTNSPLSTSGSKYSSDDNESFSTKQRENRPPNLPDDEMLSYDEEEEDLETQMLLKPSKTASHDDADEELDEELATQLEDLYRQEEDGVGGGKDDDDSKGHPSVQDEIIPNAKHTILWICICFFGIMFSFVAYGLLLEYATSGGRKLHELSFLFVTSLLYTCTGAAGRHVRSETPTTIPPARFAVLGITSMGSTFCSVRSLR